MADRKEDIAVRIAVDYSKGLTDIKAFVDAANKSLGTLRPFRVAIDTSRALKDVNSFTQSAAKSFEALPKSVLMVASAVNVLSERSTKAQADIARMTTTVNSGMNALPQAVQNVSDSVDRLTQRIERMGRNEGPEQLRRNLRQANDEAVKLTTTFDRLKSAGASIGAGIGSAVAGLAAGKAVLMPFVEPVLEYGVALAHLSNVSYSDRDKAGRIAGKKELDTTIVNSMRMGGGTRDTALSALSTMVASGAVTTEEAKFMLPGIVRGSSAANAVPEQIAGIAIRGLQNFGFKKEDLPSVIDMALNSANLGGFEVKDMARWLPQQMAEAAALGYKGKQGFAQLLSLNQAAITTAATPDMAGNNVVNLLAKINSVDTQNDFKKQGINLTGSLRAGVAQGIDPLTSFSKLIDGIMKKDKAYQQLESQLKGASGAERRDIIERQMQLQEGTAIGKVLQDRQARGAYLAFRQRGAAFTEMTEKVLNHSDGLTNQNYEVVSAQTGFKRQQALNEEENAQTTALNKIGPALDMYYDRIVRNAKAHPALTAAIEGGKIAVTTLTAAAAGASVALLLLRKNAVAAAGAMGGGAGADAARRAATGAPLRTMLVGGLKVAAPLALLGAGFDAYSVYSDEEMTKRQKKIAYTGVAGGAAGGILGGAAAGAAVGSFFPVVGTAIGGVIGGGLGYWGGSSAGTLAGEAMFGERPAVDKLLAPSMPNPAMQRALSTGYNAPPIDARLKLDISFDDSGNPFVRQKSLGGTGIRLDTGPMMAH